MQKKNLSNLNVANSLFDQKSLIQKAETNIVRACFVILISKTDKINKIEGCEELVPLPSVIAKDKPIIMQMLDCFLIPNDNQHRFIHTDEEEDVTMLKLNDTMKKIYKIAK